MEKIESTSLDITKENIEKIKEMFPNAVTEGKIDFETLQILLGSEVDEKKERFQFTWPGKTDSIKLAQLPSSATLRPCKEKSKDWETTQNLYIEGDNLEVLKQLQKTYYGRIKMIYIDPPYNTGEDFVYEDDFKNTINKYKEQTAQNSRSNPETSGRYHTDWLNMIYPRLVLARNLLSDDGVIMISIDDHEDNHLRNICDEIFGSNNFIAHTVRVSSPTQNMTKFISVMHDYTLIYCKNKDMIEGEWRVPKNNVDEFESRARKLYKQGLSEERIAEELRALTKYPRFYDFDHYNYCDSRGVFRAGPIGGVQSGNTTTQILHPITHKPCKMPKGGWRYKEEAINELIKEDKLLFGKDETIVPQTKLYLDDYLYQVPKGINFFDTQSDVHFLQQNGLPFDFPKPVEYMKYFLYMINDKNSIVLDFFSGSATTADAVMQVNYEDGGNRNFIMVQLPELVAEQTDEFHTLCDIGETRIKKAGERIQSKWKEENKSSGLFAEDKEFSVDVGFKVFKLDSTNITPWDNENELNEESLFTLDNVFKEDRTNEDVLYEIMLKYGIFDQPVAEIEVNGKTMYRIGRRHMIVCLEDNVTTNDITAISELSPRVVVFKEAGFKDDNEKINAEYNLKKAGVEDVKCV